MRRAVVTACALATTLTLSGLESGGILAARAGSDSSGKSGGGFFKKLNPFKRTYQSFDGRFIDTIEPGSVSKSKTPATEGSGLILHQTHGRGVVNEPHLQRYLSHIVDRLLVHSPVKGVSAKVFIEAEDSIIPQSEGDGTIFVPLGLIRQATAEDEIAAALAHELSHIILRHHGDAWFIEGQRRALGLSGLGLDYTTGVTGWLGDERAGRLANTTDDIEKHRANVRLSMLAGDMVVQSSFDRKKEDYADLLGVDLLIAADYNVRAVYRVLGWLGAYNKEAKKKLGDLEKEVQARLDESMSRDPGGNPLTILRHSLSKVSGKLLGTLRKTFGRDYRPAEDRIDDLKGYVAASYDPPPNPRPNKKAWEAARNQSRTRVVLAHYADARDAFASLLDGDARRAEAFGLKGISSPTGAAAYPRWVMYSVRMHQGRSRDAVANLRAAMRGPHPPLNIVLMLSTRTARDGKLKEALQLLKDADRRYKDPPQTLPPEIALYRKLGRAADANDAYAKCRVIANDNLTRDCQAAQEVPLKRRG